MARPTLYTHPKFLRLVHILGEPVPHVLGYLELLWLVAYASGNPVLGDALDAELAAQYPGQRGRLAAALLETRFLDAGADGNLAVHDLWDHAPEYVHQRMRRESTRKNRYAPRARPMTAEWREKDDLGGIRQPNSEPSATPAVSVTGQKITTIRQPNSELGCLNRIRQPNSELGTPPTPTPIREDTLLSTEECCEPSSGEASQPAPVTEEAVLRFPCLPGKKNGPREWGLTASKLAEYADAFPGIDTLAEAKKALQWLRDNPQKIKTHSGTPDYLRRWFSRSQNSGGAKASGGSLNGSMYSGLHDFANGGPLS